MTDLLGLLLIGLLSCYSLYRVFIRLRLSRAKHPSVKGHAKWSRRLARLVHFFSYSDTQALKSDGAPASIVEKRKQALRQLANTCEKDCSETLTAARKLKSSISDIQFTQLYRMPFPYRDSTPAALRVGGLADASKGVKIRDLDGNWRFDVSGSYGVNVFGYDFYKACMKQAAKVAGELGPVLGPYHPCILNNVERIKKISGLDEVSFHMSGTEAVMQAVRMARYHTRKRYLVRLCGAYHGWWDGVQPGVGNRRQLNDVYTLSDMSETTLKVLKTRNDIACVLINPLQGLHPNSDTASDVTLVASGRSAQFNRAAYTDWLHRLRKVCAERKIIFIIDEVFTGFRLTQKGAQGFFNLQADLVTYGKTLGGGYPVGVLAGRADLMKRFRLNQPADVSYARGTFNAHPYVMAAMDAFLTRIEQDDIQEIYASADKVWNARTASFNRQLEEAGLPVQIENFHSVLTVLYTKPSRFNWMLQFYLRDEGLELSWTGTGRFIMSLNYSNEDFQHVIEIFIRAASRMHEDGWWWQAPHLTNSWIKKQFAKDLLTSRFFPSKFEKESTP